MLDIVDKLADGFSSKPVPYFLALVCSVLAAVYRQLHAAQKERAEELKRERDEARAETKQVRREHMDSLVQLASTAHGLVRLNDRIQADADALEAKRRKRLPPGTATVVEKK